MIIDGLWMFSQAQAITASAASTNVHDLVNPRDIGNLSPYDLKLMVRAITAFTAAGAATLTIAVQGSVDNATYVDYAVSGAIPVASLTAGSRHFPIHLPRRVGALPRYIRLFYTVGTGPFTAGTLTSAFVLDDQESDQYAAGLTVSN